MHGKHVVRVRKGKSQIAAVQGYQETQAQVLSFKNRWPDEGSGMGLLCNTYLPGKP
jgi:hypothetical protein